MIEIVINYDSNRKEFKLYEPTTDTLLITANLGELFIQLNDFLKSQGMITDDILGTLDITYHIDSPTFLALIENNITLLKRLNTAPTAFMSSAQKFGLPTTPQPQPQQNQQFQGKGNNNYYDGKKKGYKRERGSTGFFSNSSFRGSYKKFGGK